MALLKFFEGFDYWSGTNVVSGAGKGWSHTGGSFAATTPGRFGGACLNGGGYPYTLVNQLAQGGQTALTVGLALYLDNWRPWYQPGNFIMFGQGVATSETFTVGLQTVVGSDYYLQFTDMNGNVTPIADYVEPSSAGWCYFEVTSIAGTTSTTGSVVVRQNGVIIYSGGQATGEYFDCVALQMPGSQGFSNALDDVYFYNGQGLEQQFLGPMFVNTIFPTEDASNTGSWTPSSGTSCAAVVGVSNTGSVTGSITTIGGSAEILFDMGTLTATTNTILGVQPIFYAVGAGATLAASVESSEQMNTTPQVSLPQSTPLVFAPGTFELDPATGQRWAPTAVEAAEFGMITGTSG